MLKKLMIDKYQMIDQFKLVSVESLLNEEEINKTFYLYGICANYPHTIK